MLNTVLSSRVGRVSRVSAMVSVGFSGRYKNLGPPFIGLPTFLCSKFLLLKFSTDALYHDIAMFCHVQV